MFFRSRQILIAVTLNLILPAAAADLPAQSPAQIAEGMARYRDIARSPACFHKRALVLYDTYGPWGHLGELYAIFAANLAGGWADADIVPVSEYRHGAIAKHALTIYSGTSFSEPLPADFVTDIRDANRPVLWFGYGLERLARETPDFVARFGFHPGLLDRGSFRTVIYRGQQFDRADLPGGEANGQLMPAQIDDSAKAEVLASAQRLDGSTVPWAVRAGNLTFVAENPFVNPSVADRYLVFADLVARALASGGMDRHRALVRIEDVGPESKPDALRAIASYLESRNVPFSVAVFDTFADPLATGPLKPAQFGFADKPQLIAALKYMQHHGGTLILHGHTHQYNAVHNPYSGKSGADAEFFRAHLNPDSSVAWDGPVAEDSLAWSSARLDEALQSWKSAGLPEPSIIEFPHYAASAEDYALARQRFAARYDRAFYFTGTLRPVTAEQVRFTEQFFPYPVRDVYGSLVLPEDVGGFDAATGGLDLRTHVQKMLQIAAKDFVLQDGVASFYFHRTLPLEHLRDMVEALQDRGWTFVSPQSLIDEKRCH